MKKSILLGVAAAFLIAAPGSAKDAEPAFSLDTPIEKIAANPAGLALIEAELTGLLAHPNYEQYKTRSINELSVMLGGSPPERLAAMDKMLRAIPADTAKPTAVATDQSIATAGASPVPGK